MRFHDKGFLLVIEAIFIGRGNTITIYRISSWVDSRIKLKRQNTNKRKGPGDYSPSPLQKVGRRSACSTGLALLAYGHFKQLAQCLAAR
jgi:hypothetical protein